MNNAASFPELLCDRYSCSGRPPCLSARRGRSRNHRHGGLWLLTAQKNLEKLPTLGGKLSGTVCHLLDDKGGGV